MPPDVARETQPCVSLHIRVGSLATALDHVAEAGFAPRRSGPGIAVMAAAFLGNALLVFEEG